MGEYVQNKRRVNMQKCSWGLVLVILCAFSEVGFAQGIGKSCEKCSPVKNSSIYSKNLMDCPQQSIKYTEFIKKVQNERAVVYNALNLTDEQIKVREELFQKNNPCYEKKFEELIKESYKLKALKCANASECDILKQKKVVKGLKKGINNLSRKEDREFRKILSHDQRAKYSMIKKLERKEYKAAAHQKDYYKSNPRLPHFGNPVVCPCSVDTAQKK